ncbi:MAG: ABC transporter [Lachnospiraceae bacterium]|nr:ABC transporter [Candidatus Equihabitans merdae]
MAAIYKRELQSYFMGIIGYVFVAFLLVIFGIYTATICLTSKYANFEYVPYAMKYVFLITTPILSMRVLSEERKLNTDKLLFSTAVESYKIVFGKYLAMLTVMAIPFIVTCAYPVILSKYGKVPMLTAYSSIFGLFLMGAALLAIGMFSSSLTDSQIVAAAICFGMILAAYLANDITGLVSKTVFSALIGYTVIVLIIGGITRYVSKSWSFAGSIVLLFEILVVGIYFIKPSLEVSSFSGLLGTIAVFDKMDTFKNGVFDISTVIYYLSVIGVFSFFSIQSLEKRRWG